MRERRKRPSPSALGDLGVMAKKMKVEVCGVATPNSGQKTIRWRLLKKKKKKNLFGDERNLSRKQNMVSFCKVRLIRYFPVGKSSAGFWAILCPSHALEKIPNYNRSQGCQMLFLKVPKYLDFHHLKIWALKIPDFRNRYPYLLSLSATAWLGSQQYNIDNHTNDKDTQADFLEIETDCPASQVSGLVSHTNHRRPDRPVALTECPVTQKYC